MNGWVAATGEHGHLDVGFAVGPLWLRVVLLAAVLAVAAFAMLRGFLAEPDRRTTIAVVTAATCATSLELLLSGGLALPDQAVPPLLAALALPLYLVLSRDPDRARVVEVGRRFAPWVFWPVTVLAVILFARGWFGGAERARTAMLLHTGVVLGLVAIAWFAVARPRRGIGVAGRRVGAGLLATGLVAGVAQAVVSRPADTIPGLAATAVVEVGARPVNVVVVPNLPGWNLVHVDVAGVAVATDPTALGRPGPAGWRAVELPAGQVQLWVGDRRGTASLVTDTGTSGAGPSGLTGPDGAECASALLGRMLATGSLTGSLTCPADVLTPEDADALRGAVHRLADGGATAVAVLADTSQRSRSAVATIRSAAATRGLVVVEPGGPAAPLVVVSGWTRADERAGTTGTTGTTTTYLAPWLSNRSGVTSAGAADAFRRYEAALRGTYPTQRPSAAGFRGFAGGSPTTGRRG